MPTLYDVAHLVAWNGYAKDMIPYLGVDKAAWNNYEFWFPHVANFRHGHDKKTRIQLICEKITYYGSSRYKYASKDYIPKRIQKLLDLGAKLLPDENGWSALLECCRSPWLHKIAEILIEAGADVNQKAEGWTPLELASYNNNIPIVRLLLAKGADVNCGELRSPLSGAVKMGNLEVAKLLISKGALITRRVYEDAIYGGYIPIIKYLATIQPVPVDSIAYAMQWNEKSIPILAKLGGDVNYVKGGQTLVEKYIWKVERLKILLKAGADPNITGTPGATPPIFTALYTNDVESVRALVEKCDVNIVLDHTLKTPIHLAILLYSMGNHTKEHLEIIKILIKKSDLSWQNSSGHTPVQAAQYSGLDDLVILMKRELLGRKS